MYVLLGIIIVVSIAIVVLITNSREGISVGPDMYFMGGLPPPSDDADIFPTMTKTVGDETDVYEQKLPGGYPGGYTLDWLQRSNPTIGPMGDPRLVGVYRNFSEGNKLLPSPLRPMSDPVPRNSLKATNEHYKSTFYNMRKPLDSRDYFHPYEANFDTDIVDSDIPFYSSVDKFAPFPEIDTPWEKTGLLKTVETTNPEIMNVYRKAIAPIQDVYQYVVQDKDGFVIPLKNVTYMQNGDIIKSVIGKENKGEWQYVDVNQNKYVWM